MQTYWLEFLRFHAAMSKAGTIDSFPGVEAVWGNSAFAFNNGMCIVDPIVDASDLWARCQTIVDEAAKRELPYLVNLFEPALPAALFETGDDVLQEFGFVPYLKIRVMTGDVRTLLPPSRPLPEMEFEVATTRELQLETLHINCAAYDVPNELGDAAMEAGLYYQRPDAEFCVAGKVDGKAVSTTAINVLGDTLYVALVATLPEHQRKGYGDAVMRYALQYAADKTGLHKTALDASAMGEPVYARMGYKAHPDYWRTYFRH